MPRSKGDELVEVLDLLIKLLADDGEEFWREWLQTARRQIANRDIAGVEKMLEAYGGMGSFNDLEIFQDSGCRRPRFEEANNQLRLFQNEAYGLATAIMRDFLQGKKVR